MNLNTGDAAPCNAEFACIACHTRVSLNAGQVLPRCPKCSGQVFQKTRELAGRMIFAPDNREPVPREHDLRPH